MANELSTAGVKVGFAFEATAGTRPEVGYQRIPGVKSTPDLNPEPSALEVTTLEDEEWKRYIPSLRDPGGALGFTCNNTSEFQGAWLALCLLSEAAEADGKATWFVVTIPGLTDSFFFKAVPSALGVLGMDVDAVAEVTAYVSPNDVEGWETAPTDPAVYITPIPTQFVTTANSPLTVTPVLDEGDAILDTAVSSNTDVATVTEDGTDVVITKVGAGTCFITLTTDSDPGYSAGKTVFKVVVS